MAVRLMRLGALVVAAAIVAGETSGTSVGQPQPESMVLPEVPLVAVTNRAGEPPRQLPTQGRWFLVYLEAHCSPCDALLSRIQNEARAIAPRLVIVISGSAPADAARMMSTFAALDTAAWFADQPAALSAALHIEETPLVLAMNDRSIQWTVGGSLSGTKGLRDVLTGWVVVPGR